MGPATDAMLAAARLSITPNGAGITEVPEPSMSDMMQGAANLVIDVRDRRGDATARETVAETPLAGEMAALLESFGARLGAASNLPASGASHSPSNSGPLLAAPWEGPCVHVQKRGSCAKGPSCKTILCKHHFLEKYCKHGSQECYFAHSEEEQRPAAPFYKPKQRPCTRFLQEGKLLRLFSGFWSFLKTCAGFCVFGKNCIFWHKRPPETCTTSPSSSPAPEMDISSRLGSLTLGSSLGSMEPDRALSLAIAELQSALRLPIDSRSALLRVLKTMEVAGSVAMDSVVILGSGFAVLGHQLEWLERVRLFAESIETLRSVLKSSNAVESVLAVVMQAVEQSSLALLGVVPPLPLVQNLLKLLVHVARGLQHALVTPSKAISRSPSNSSNGLATRTLYLVMSRSTFETLASHLRSLLDRARIGGLVLVSGEAYRTREVTGPEPGALTRHADLFQQASDDSLYKLSDGRLVAHLHQLASAHAGGDPLFVLFSPALSLPPQERMFDAILATIRTALPVRASGLVVRSPSGGYVRSDVRTISEDEFCMLLAEPELLAQLMLEASNSQPHFSSDPWNMVG